MKALRVRAAFSSIILFALSCGSTFGQSSLDQVHIVPESGIRPIPNQDLRQTSESKPIRKNVDLVLIPVTITDWRDRLVTGLERENFQVFENRQRQEIKHFSSEDTPVSIGIIFDLSGSMAAKIDRAREAVLELCRTANPQDEFFFITFSDQPELQKDFTERTEDIAAKLIAVVPKGSTALLDAIYLGLTHMRKAKHAKKALFVMSDGGDNHSRYSERQVKRLAKEADVLIYGIGVYDRYFSTVEEAMGPELLSEIAGVTGGRAFQVDNPNDLPRIAARISLELRHQYLLGYRPADSPKDGKWHKIKVKLNIPRKLSGLLVNAKPGYYAATR
jgi:Ca-activated chloride channel family protein